ncbi:MAG TPA: hypothetical protein VK045_11105 [Ornithinicoccus sp.]|nr:hypothetical protein [Ornithinicoccus sp.]
MRRTSPLRTLAVAASLSTLLLAGCSGDDPSVEAPTDSQTTTGATVTDDAEATSAPPDTDTETATGSEDAAPTGPVTSDDGAFEVTAPEGWLDVTSQVEQKVEIALRDDEMTDDFYTNLVVASEDPIEDLEASIEEAAESVAGADGQYEMLDPIEIDGEEAYGYVLTRTTSGVAVAQTQRWVEHGDRLYVITFSSAKGQQEATESVMEEILSTWRWQD